MQEQVARFTHTCFMVTPYDGYVEVCEALDRLTPGDHEKRSALFNSGAEAVENAVKIARAHTERQAVVVFDHGYHGRTNLTMALTAKNMPYKHSFGPFAPEVYRVPMSYPFRDPAGMTGEQAAARALDLVEKQVGADNVACIVIEPIQGEGGFVVPAPGFLAGAGRGGAPTTARCSWPTRSSPASRAPATGSPATTRASCRTWSRPPRASPAGCRWPRSPVGPRSWTRRTSAASAAPTAATRSPAPRRSGAIETMETLDLCGRARRIGEVMTARLRELASTYDVIGDVRGRGAMVAVELTRPGTLEPDAAATAAVAKACHADGLVVLTCGTYGNVLRLLPPLVMPEHLLDEGLGVLEKAFAGLA